MFTWIMGTLGAGVLMPNVLRWYWWRMNGWGYAAGAVSGMLLSLIQAFLPRIAKLLHVTSTGTAWSLFLSRAEAFVLKIAGLPLYVTFPAIVLLVLGITVAVTLLTRPTDPETLRKFYTEVRPSGFWKPVAAKLPPPEPRKRRPMPARSLWSILVGIPWLISLYLLPTYLVLHRFSEALSALTIVAAGSLALYFTWYKGLAED
jgi:SSS family solute:Na+ symporter